MGFPSRDLHETDGQMQHRINHPDFTCYQAPKSQEPSPPKMQHVGIWTYVMYTSFQINGRDLGKFQCL